MWAEVRARINRVDAVATRKLIPDKKLEAVLNLEYAKLRPIDPIPGIGDDEDFGNIFESAGTISILMRNLKIPYCVDWNAHTRGSGAVLEVGTRIRIPEQWKDHDGLTDHQLWAGSC
eukprot:4517324-Amphidinium_carterae.1